jgi:diadenylate cyclase
MTLPTESTPSKIHQFAQSILTAVQLVLHTQQVRTVLLVINDLEQARDIQSSFAAENLIWATHDASVDRWLSESHRKHIFWQNRYSTNLLTQVAYYTVAAVAQGMLRANEPVILVNWPAGRPYPNQLHIFKPNEEFQVIKYLDRREGNRVLDPTVFLAVMDVALALGSVRHAYVRGTMITVGDAQKILGFSRPLLFEPFQFYPREQRNISDPAIRKTFEKYTRLDAAFVLAEDGTIEAVVEMINPPRPPIDGLQGLGSRHTAASAISLSANAYVIVISQSAGNVTVFADGQIVLTLKPQSLHL